MTELNEQLTGDAARAAVSQRLGGQGILQASGDPDGAARRIQAIENSFGTTAPEPTPTGLRGPQGGGISPNRKR